MRVAFVLPEVKSGGIATYYSNLVRKLLQRGIGVVTILGNFESKALNPEFPGTVTPISKDDYAEGLQRVSRMDILPGIRHRLALSYACHTALKRSGDVDVVESTDYNLLFYYLLLDKVAPVVVRLAGSSGQLEIYERRTDDGVESAFLFMLEQSVMRRADYLISLSELNKQFWSSLLPNDINVHLPYLNFDQYPASPFADRNAPGVVAGRLQLWKGAKFLCDYYTKYPDSPHIEWIGRDNYYLRHGNSMASYLAHTYPQVWDRQLKYTGRKDYTATQKAIAEASFVLVPSIWDTFNFVVTESMWKGKVTLVSRGVGAAELIEHGRNGFLFDAGSPESLHNTFEEFCSASDQRLQEIASEARSLVVKSLSDENLVEDRIAVYRSLTGKASAGDEPFVDFLNEKFHGSGSGAESILRQQKVGDLMRALTQKFLRR